MRNKEQGTNPRGTDVPATPAIPHFSLLTSHFSLLTSNFSLLTSNFSLLNRSPRRPRSVRAKGSQPPHTTNAPAAPRRACRVPVNQARKLVREPRLQTGQARLGARGSRRRRVACEPCAPVGQADWGRSECCASCHSLKREEASSFGQRRRAD